jgi:hypothetical protein
MFLPTCSPEVHSAEHLWLLIHEALAKMHFETLDDLDGALAQRCPSSSTIPITSGSVFLLHWRCCWRNPK